MLHMTEAWHEGRSISRRVAVGAVLAAGAGAILWPHTPRGRASVPKGRAELRYWEKWTGIEGLALQRVVDRYNATQGEADKAWVHLVPVSDITSKAMVAIGGNDPPDVVGLYSYSVPGYAVARAAMPLDGFAGWSGGLASRPYLRGVRDLLEHEGHQWAGVNTCYTLGMYHNRAMLREIGRDPDRPPRTIAELDELSDALTMYEAGGRDRLARAGFLANVPGWWSYFWPIMFGGTLYDQQYDRATIDTPECSAAFEWLRASAKRVGVEAATAFASGYGRNMHTAQDPFISGRMGMIVQGPWLANFIRQYRPDLDYAAAPVPVAESVYDPEHPSGLLEADILMIPRGCPHPEEAFRFLCFMQRQDVQEELALAHGKPSPFVSTTPGFVESHPNRSVRVFDAIARSPKVQILPRTTAWKQYSDLINTAFDLVWKGADARATLVGVRARAQQLIDTAAARKRQRAGR
jgi:ABC-type glycerol-3-phosphate transport system substrate-binding protein